MRNLQSKMMADLQRLPSKQDFQSEDDLKKFMQGENANKKLDIAMKQNKFVASILLLNKPRLDFPSFYGLGDENEAKYYTGFAAYI